MDFTVTGALHRAAADQLRATACNHDQALRKATVHPPLRFTDLPRPLSFFSTPRLRFPGCWPLPHGFRRASVQQMKPLLGLLATLLISSSAISAHALTVSVSDGSFSSMAGAYTIDFGVSPINNTGVVSGSLPGGTLGGVQYSYSGGALFNYNAPPSNLANGISARPVGSTGNYWSVGSSPTAQQGPGVVTFDSGVSYFGFLWGSPDAYNIVSFYDGAQLLGAFNGSAILVPPNGDQAFSKYFNIYAEAGQKITKINFASTTNAFETDNQAFVPSIPEPEIYAMMLAGLGLMGFVARRRNQQTQGQPAAA